MKDVYFSLGANQGDRRRGIELALCRLDTELGGRRKALSGIIETEAWGFKGEPFLNCAVCYETELPAVDILLICKKIEKEMGRNESVEHDLRGRRIYHDRPIDIDILLYGNEHIDTPELKIPHPLMKERDFVMRPLMEICDSKYLNL